MPDTTGQSAANHEGAPETLPITKDQLSAMTANVVHLLHQRLRRDVLHQLRQEMYAELQQQVASVQADNEHRWDKVREQVPALLTDEFAAFVRKQLPEYMRAETITAKELAG